MYIGFKRYTIELVNLFYLFIYLFNWDSAH